jgi:hypothetical protein
VRIKSVFINVSLSVFPRSVDDMAIKNEGLRFGEKFFDFVLS